VGTRIRYFVYFAKRSTTNELDMLRRVIVAEREAVHRPCQIVHDTVASNTNSVWRMLSQTTHAQNKVLVPSAHRTQFSGTRAALRYLALLAHEICSVLFLISREFSLVANDVST
jgi:hypothetical protein